jgi:hypothetical protein
MANLSIRFPMFFGEYSSIWVRIIDFVALSQSFVHMYLYVHLCHTRKSEASTYFWYQRYTNVFQNMMNKYEERGHRPAGL